MSVKPYQFFDHTADIGMHVFGNSLEELFQNASRGMLSLIFKSNDIVPESTLTLRESIHLKADSVDLLLLKWLQEILFRIEIHNKIYYSFQFEIIPIIKNNLTHYKLNGYISGETYDLNRHEICMEIKAVTRHQFSVIKNKNGWEANIIFDV